MCYFSINLNNVLCSLDPNMAFFSHCFPIFISFDCRLSYRLHEILSICFLDRKTMLGTPPKVATWKIRLISLICGTPFQVYRWTIESSTNSWTSSSSRIIKLLINLRFCTLFKWLKMYITLLWLILFFNGRHKKLICLFF